MADPADARRTVEELRGRERMPTLDDYVLRYTEEHDASADEAALAAYRAIRDGGLSVSWAGGHVRLVPHKVVP